MNILKITSKTRIRYIHMDKITHVDVSKTGPEVRVNFVRGDHETWDIILVNSDAIKFMDRYILMVSEQGELY